MQPRYPLDLREETLNTGILRQLDISPFLLAGKNVIAAQVWNEGVWRAEGQISLRTGFILQGNR